MTDIMENIEAMTIEEKLVWKCLDEKSYREDLIEIMYSKYEDSYIYTKSGTWYEYKNHRYQEIDAIAIRNKLSSELSDSFIKFMRKYLQVDLNKEIKIELKNKIQECIRIIKNLENMTYKTGIYREACYRFYDETFDNNANKNKNLVCFTNGVF